jgi:hypothetical protein
VSRPAASSPGASRLLALWDRFWFSEDSLLRLGVFRVLVLVVTAYSLKQPASFIFRYAGTTREQIPRVWNPVYFLEALGAGPPSPALARAVLAVLLIATGLGVLGLFTRGATAVVAVLAMYWWGLGYSFDQAHHDKISLAFAVLALPFSPCGARFSLDALIRARRGAVPPEASPFAAWPIRLTQVSVASAYMFSGLTKLFVSGLEWMNGFTLQSTVFLDHPLTELIAGDVRIAQLASIGVIFLQTTFPLIYLHPWLRWFYVPGCAAFHLGAWVTMSTGPFYTLWLVAFLAFYRVELLPSTLLASWREGRRPMVIAQVALLAAFLALSVAIMAKGDPWWSPALLVAALAVIAAILLRSPGVCPGAPGALAARP